MEQAGATRICGSCGRRFGWRRKWADSWAQIRYCSERSRRRRLRPVDLARGPSFGASFDPSFGNGAAA